LRGQKEASVLTDGLRTLRQLTIRDLLDRRSNLVAQSLFPTGSLRFAKIEGMAHGALTA
jgi:hypothetical protein